MFAGNNIMEICFTLVVIDLFIVNNIQNKVKTKLYLIEIADDNVNDVKVDESLEHDVDDRSERKQNNAQDDVFNNKQDYDDSSGKKSKGSHREHGNKGENNKHRHKINIKRIKRFGSKHGKGNMENVKDSSGKRSKGSHSEHGNKGENNKHGNKSNKYMTESLSSKQGEGNMKNVKGKYSKMQDGYLCSGSSSQITTEADCKAAADKLNLKWNGGWNGDRDFPGCLHVNDWRNEVYFNRSPIPNNTAINPKYAAICQISKGNESGTEDGVNSQKNATTKVPGGSLCVEDNVKYLGQAVSDTGKKVPNEQKCNMYCEKVSKCDIWAYHKKRKTCQLKIFHDHIKKVNNNAYASGLKDCSKGVPIYCKEKVVQDECESNKKLKGKMEFDHILSNNCEYCKTGIAPSSVKRYNESMPADKNI